jgi:general secretion pathway protein G
MEQSIKIGKKNSGFTLFELVIVVSVILVLATLVVPLFQGVLLQAKETTLKDTLYKMRDAIDKYTLDKEEAPQSLEDLVSAKYLREIPIDPITSKNDSWEVELEDEAASRSGRVGIRNVYSGAQGESTTGRPYREF